MLAIPNFEAGDYLVFGTRKGEVKRSALTQFVSIRTNGLTAMDLDEDDELVLVRLATDETHAMFFTRTGMSIRFSLEDVRATGRISGGMRAIRLAEGDEIAAMDLTKDNGFVLLVTSNGFGKKVAVSEFRPQRRPGQGLKAINLSEKTGAVVDARTLLAEKRGDCAGVVGRAGDALRAWERASDQAGGGRRDHHAHGRGRGPAAGGAAGGWARWGERQRVARLRGFRSCLRRGDGGRFRGPFV